MRHRPPANGCGNGGMSASGNESAARPGRAVNPLAIGVFAVALLIGGLLLWLSFAGDPTPPQVVVALPEDVSSGPEVLGTDTAKPDVPVTRPDEIPEAPTSGLQQIGSLTPVEPGEGLREAPISGLYVETGDGLLPIIANDGRRAVASYARPFEIANGPDGAPLPRVAVMVMGLGLNKTFADRAMEQLPAEVTLAFTPYGPDLQNMISEARADGHEVALELPMEPFDYPDNDPGPYTLLTSLPAEANARRLSWLLTRAAGYFAVVNRQGARYLSDEGALKPTLAELKSRGLGFIDTGESNRAVTASAAPSGDFEWAAADEILDASNSTRNLDRALANLEQKARTNGSALGVGMALPVTVERIAEWAESLEAKGIQLVPVSAMLMRGET